PSSSPPGRGWGWVDSDSVLDPGKTEQQIGMCACAPRPLPLFLACTGWEGARGPGNQKCSWYRDKEFSLHVLKILCHGTGDVPLRPSSPKPGGILPRLPRKCRWRRVRGPGLQLVGRVPLGGESGQER